MNTNQGFNAGYIAQFLPELLRPGNNMNLQVNFGLAMTK